jgi:uncharacterized membrane protein
MDRQVLSILMESKMRDDSEIPPDWDDNPSSWTQRWPIIAIAMVGFIIATYLALFQYEVIPDIWEPFFGEGSRKVLTSWISNALPVSDAALGAFAYLVDAVTGAIGGTKRWKTMPWMVVLFGIAVGPLGAVSLFLVIAQPVLLGHWCTLCLITAFISIVMIGPAMDELLASLQYLRREYDRGHSLWRAFWGIRGGGTPLKPISGLSGGS